ncbi:MAG: T9SS type A sorting domain-containing protein [Lentimicrobiaceae bacterium]|nr:T9SS type A sorting domain-containing protein [Lentimicrobiaceae bacterium]
MNYKVFLLLAFLLAHHFNAISQNKMIEEKVLALTTIEAPSFTIHFEYNQFGWVTSETQITREDSYLSYKFEYEYDEFGNITLLKKYDRNSGVWNFIHYEESEYNDNNQMVTKKIYTDYGAGFKWVEQQLFTYQDIFLETAIYQNVNSTGNVFNNTKRLYSYNKELQLFLIKEYAWISINNDWMHIETFDFEYDDVNNMLNYSNEYLTGDDFVKHWRYVFTYNDAHEAIERSFYYGAFSEWNTRPSNKYFYHFETTEEDETILFPNIYKFDVLNFNWFQPGKKLIQADYWVADCSNVLHFVETANYFYRLLTIGVEVKDYDKEGVLVFPNPMRDELRIRNYELGTAAPLGASSAKLITNIEIFDIHGRNVGANLRVRPNTEIEYKIDISHLPTGIYFIKITTKTNTQTQKIIKL